MKPLYVFLATALMDVFWAQYIRATAGKRAFAGGVYAALLLGLSATVVMAYVNNVAMILPAMAGAFVGTYLGTQYGD